MVIDSCIILYNILYYIQRTYVDLMFNPRIPEKGHDPQRRRYLQSEGIGWTNTECYRPFVAKRAVLPRRDTHGAGVAEHGASKVDANCAVCAVNGLPRAAVVRVP